MSKRLANPEALQALRQQAKGDIDLRGEKKEMRLTVHMGTCGIAAGARDVLALLIAELGKAKVDKVSVRQSGCAGLCDQEPMLTLTDAQGHEYRYGRLDKNKVIEIIEGHVQGGKPVTKHLVNA
jgi:NADP-reducing hydrogenase subunit HndB